MNLTASALSAAGAVAAHSKLLLRCFLLSSARGKSIDRPYSLSGRERLISKALRSKRALIAAERIAMKSSPVGSLCSFRFPRFAGMHSSNQSIPLASRLQATAFLRHEIAPRRALMPDLFANMATPRKHFADCGRPLPESCVAGPSKRSSAQSAAICDFLIFQRRVLRATYRASPALIFRRAPAQALSLLGAQF